MTPRARRKRRAFLGVIAAAGLTVATAALPAAAAALSGDTAPGRLAAFRVVADGIPEPIDAAQGDAQRGRALILARDAANCLLCHALQEPNVRVAGNLGPPLDGIGRKLSPAQLRLRIVDNLRLDPTTIMPSYYRVDGLDRVASAYRGKPMLTAVEVEDIVAYLATLK